MLAARLNVLGAALLFSTGGAAIKLSTLSNWQIACFRSGIAALLLWLLVPAWRAWWRPASLAVGLCAAATLILFVTANTLTTAANAIFLQYSAPLYLLLIGPLILGETNRRSDAAVIALLATGMLLLFAGQQPLSRSAPDPMRGNIFAALSGVTWASTLAGLRWLGRAGGATNAGGQATVAGNLIACLVTLPWALGGASPSRVDTAVVAYLGVFQVGAAYLCLLRGVPHLRALEVSLLLASEPVASTLFAWLLHGELPGVTAGLGCAFIFAGALVQALRPGGEKPRT